MYEITEDETVTLSGRLDELANLFAKFDYVPNQRLLGAIYVSMVQLSKDRPPAAQQDTWCPRHEMRAICGRVPMTTVVPGDSEQLGRSDRTAFVCCKAHAAERGRAGRRSMVG